MINIKISMINSEEYYITNPIIDNLKEWIKKTLMPHNVQLIWFEVEKNTYILVNNILEIRELSEEELSVLTLSDIALEDNIVLEKEEELDNDNN